MDIPNISKQKIAMDLLDAMDETSQSMFYVIQDGHFVYGNTHGCHITGLEPIRDVYGKPALAYVHPEDKPLLAQMSRDAMAGRQVPPFEWRLHTVDGRVVWVMGVLTKINFDGRPAIFGNYIDITQVKQTRSELRRTSKKIEDLTFDLQSIREEERAQIAWELKENLWYSLAAIKKSVSDLWENPHPDAKESLHYKIDSSLKTIERIYAHLTPPETPHQDLTRAIRRCAQEFKEKTGIAVSVLPFRDEPDLGQKQMLAIFKRFQETLKTIAGIGRVETIRVSMQHGDGSLEIRLDCDVNAVKDGIDFTGSTHPFKDLSETIRSRSGSFEAVIKDRQLIVTAGFLLAQGTRSGETRILLGCAQPILLQGVKNILSGLPDLRVSYQVDTFLDLMEKVKTRDVDMVLIDSILLGGQATDNLRKIKDDFPYLPVLVYHSIADDDDFAVRLLRQGASGYISRSSSTDELVSAVHKVANGRKHISNRIAEKLAFEVDLYTPKPFHHKLSDRERQVMFMIAEGRTMRDIAGELCLSYKTVVTYRNRVLEKMNMRTNTEIVRYVISKGLI